MHCFLYFFLVLSHGILFSETSFVFDLDRILSRDEEQASKDWTESNDIAIPNETPLLLATTNGPGTSDNMFDLTGADPNALVFDGGAESDGKELLGSSDNLLIPNDAQPGDLYAFHDGDLPPPGWGDCTFPKTPACCIFHDSDSYCVWYSVLELLCPPHPDDIINPRTSLEKIEPQPVCCDQVTADGVGIGCEPVKGRIEDEVLDLGEGLGEGDGVWPDDIFWELRQFNNLRFEPAPNSCKTRYRRDEGSPAECLQK